MTVRAARDLLDRAKALDAEILGAGFRRPAAPTTQVGPPADPLAQFDALINEPELIAVTRPLYGDGHYARAVEEAFKYLNNAVQSKSGDTTHDGNPLMLSAFAEAAPLLRLNALRSQSEKNEQKGYSFIMAGAMTGIRNPRAHDHGLRDEPEHALEMLVLANHLTRMVRRSVRTRRRRGRANP